MSGLKRIKIVVKNYDLQTTEDLDELYNRVSLEDEEGQTFTLNRW